MTSKPKKQIDPIIKAQRHAFKEIRKFMKEANRVQAPEEDKVHLAKIWESTAQWFHQLNDGRSWVSESGWVAAIDASLENTKREGVMVRNEKGRIERMTTSKKKEYERFNKRFIKPRKREYKLLPQLLIESELYWSRHIQPIKAQNMQNKKRALSEGVFGSKNGSSPPGGSLE